MLVLKPFAHEVIDFNYQAGIDPNRVLGGSAANLRKLWRLPKTPSSEARGSSALRSFFVPNIFARRKITSAFNWPNLSRSNYESLSEARKNNGVVVICSLFEKRASGLYHNTAAIIDADGSLLGIYRKMHIPDDRSITRNSIHSR